jgi:hypothetical protein
LSYSALAGEADPPIVEQLISPNALISTEPIEEAPKKWSLSSAATSCGRSREVLHLLRFEHLHARPLPPRLAGREARAQQILDRQQGVALVFVGAGAAG